MESFPLFALKNYRDTTNFKPSENVLNITTECNLFILFISDYIMNAHAHVHVSNIPHLIHVFSPVN